MALSIAKVASWLHSVDKARAVVGWWPAQFATDDELTVLVVPLLVDPTVNVPGTTTLSPLMLVVRVAPTFTPSQPVACQLTLAFTGVVHVSVMLMVPFAVYPVEVRLHDVWLTTTFATMLVAPVTELVRLVDAVYVFLGMQICPSQS